VIGERLHDKAHFPQVRYRANRFACFWISWAAGHPIADSQSGFRVYSNAVMAIATGPRMRASRFAFESEILVEAADQGHLTLAVAIPGHYPVEARPSHFRPVADIAGIARMVAVRLLKKGLYPQGLRRSLAPARVLPIQGRRWQPARPEAAILEGDAHPTALAPMPHTDYPGNLFVIAAPSGAGKSSLVSALLQVDSRLVVAISHTTRAVRGQEQNGREYHFIDPAAFRAMAEGGEFFEWAEVHGHLYGTSRAAIEDRITGGMDVVLEIDWQGALQIKALFPNAVLIFILPPSWEELLERLRRRGEDRPEAIERRMENARLEVSQARHFDFVIINGLFETALFDLKAIVHAQRLKYAALRRDRPAVFAALALD
jgi:guanylate kinase